jgi:hypothetical protein
MEESFDRLWEIQKLLEILHSIFSKVYSTSNDQAAEKFFSLQIKGSFQTMYCQEMFLHENTPTVQMHWLHLQHQSALEERETMPCPTGDSNTCHSDITVCSSKGMSSKTAYEEFLLFPSNI